MQKVPGPSKGPGTFWLPEAGLEPAQGVNSPTDFKSVVSAIPPLGRTKGIIYHLRWNNVTGFFGERNYAAERMAFNAADQRFSSANAALIVS